MISLLKKLWHKRVSSFLWILNQVYCFYFKFSALSQNQSVSMFYFKFVYIYNKNYYTKLNAHFYLLFVIVVQQHLKTFKSSVSHPKIWNQRKCILKPIPVNFIECLTIIGSMCRTPNYHFFHEQILSCSEIITTKLIFT